MQNAFNNELKATIESKCAADRWYGLKGGKMKRGKVAKDYLTLAETLKSTLGDQAGDAVARLQAMAEYAREIYRTQARAELNVDLIMLDPLAIDGPALDSHTKENLFEACRKEPWVSARSVQEMERGTGGSVYGYLTDRFAVAMQLFAKDTPEHEKLELAYFETSDLYNDQMTGMAFAATRKISDERCQEIREMLWGLARIYEGEQTTRSMRLVNLAIMIGTYHHDQSVTPDKRTSRPVKVDPDAAAEFKRNFKRPSPNIGDKPSPV